MLYNALKDNIGHVDKKTALLISKILSNHQTFHSQFEIKNTMIEEQMYEQIFQIIKIVCLTCRLFPYARAPENKKFNKIFAENKSVEKEEMIKRLEFLELEYYGFGTAYSRCDKIYKRITQKCNSKINADKN